MGRVLKPDVFEYPPPEHFLRDLAVVSWLETETVAVAELTVTPAVLDRSGQLGLGALISLVDIACARATLASAAPDWVTTADLSLHTRARPSTRSVRAEARLVRVGSRLIHVDVDLGPVGGATAAFVRIPSSSSRVEAAPVVLGERSTMAGEAAMLEAPLTSRMGLRFVDGAAEVDASEYLANSVGSVNGGVLGFLVAAAAEEATGWPAADATLRYLGQTRIGPARATPVVVRRSPDHAVVDVTVRDLGADEHPVVRASVTTTRGHESQ